MLSYVELTPSSRGLLPASCALCMWWQTGDGNGCAPSGVSADKTDWLERAVTSWGSPGLLAVDGERTVACVQFALVSMLPRAVSLPPGYPGDGVSGEDAILLHCLRTRVGRPPVEGRRLLDRALADLYRRGFRKIYAYAMRVGSEDVCGSRNLFGFEFLVSAGFHVAGTGQGLYLMHVDLSGVVPPLMRTLREVWRDRREATVPSPVTFSRWSE